jgi:hypothetical protein
MHPMSLHPTSLSIQKDLKSHIDPNTVVVGDFNTLLPPKYRSFRHKVNKEIPELSDTIDLMGLRHLQNIPVCKSTIYILLSSA